MSISAFSGSRCLSIRAEAPVVLTLKGRMLEIGPTVLAGQRSRIEFERSSLDLDGDRVLAHAEVTLDPQLARLLPVLQRFHRIDVRSPLTVLDDLVHVRRATRRKRGQLHEVRNALGVLEGVDEQLQPHLDHTGSSARLIRASAR